LLNKAAGRQSFVVHFHFISEFIPSLTCQLSASKLDLSEILPQNLIFLWRCKICDWFIEEIVTVFLPLFMRSGGNGAVSV